jgi:hypothetical protein
MYYLNRNGRLIQKQVETFVSKSKFSYEPTSTETYCNYLVCDFVQSLDPQSTSKFASIFGRSSVWRGKTANDLFFLLKDLYGFVRPISLFQSEDNEAGRLIDTGHLVLVVASDDAGTKHGHMAIALNSTTCIQTGGNPFGTYNTKLVFGKHKYRYVALNDITLLQPQKHLSDFIPLVVSQGTPRQHVHRTVAVAILSTVVLITLIICVWRFHEKSS